MKTCTKCHKVKSKNEFYRSKREKDGYNFWCKACYKVWQTEHQERLREYWRNYHYEHIEERKAYRKQQYQNNKEYYAQRARAWDATNPERKKELHRKWKSNNKDKVNADTQRRRARIRGLPYDLTAEDWQDILFVYDHRCAYCMRYDTELEQEHFIPASRGGGYTIDNIIPACSPCNTSKGNKLPSEWR